MWSLAVHFVHLAAELNTPFRNAMVQALTPDGNKRDKSEPYIEKAHMTAQTSISSRVMLNNIKFSNDAFSTSLHGATKPTCLAVEESAWRVYADAENFSRLPDGARAPVNTASRFPNVEPAPGTPTVQQEYRHDDMASPVLVISSTATL